MYYDLTLKITSKIIKDANGNDKFSLTGHLGTHFDVMDKVFPLDYLRLPAIVYDVSLIRNRDITENDINLNYLEKGLFVAFYTGYVDEYGYGNKEYFKDHIQLSRELIDLLLEKQVRIIGIDAPGIRRGKEHTPIDQYCANHDVFVVENMDGMKALLQGEKQTSCLINTFPVNYSDLTGLPCRIVAEK